MAEQYSPSLTELNIFLLDYEERAPLIIKANALEAKVKRAKFLSLTKEGFTEAQAIELCRG